MVVAEVVVIAVVAVVVVAVVINTFVAPRQKEFYHTWCRINYAYKFQAEPHQRIGEGAPQ